MYDTTRSRYVTLDDIAQLIRAGEQVRVVDNVSQDDLTIATMAQIIFEEQRRAPTLTEELLVGIIRGH